MRVALVGNQNSGKTSLFNKLTGSNQKTGNWPGVTVEKKEGVIKSQNIEVVDLPGVYSLMPYTEEENITREYILKHKPDFIINVVDANCLERSLYLSTQLMDLETPMVIALNMVDILEKKGLKVDEKALAKRLGVDIVKISAKSGSGLKNLINIIKTKKTQKSAQNTQKYPKIIENIVKNIKNNPKTSNNFTAIEALCFEKDNFDIKRNRDILSKLYGDDLEHVIASERYNFISEVAKQCVFGVKKKNNISKRLDNILLNKWLAIPIFFVMMVVMYFLSVSLVGGVVSEYLIAIFDRFKTWSQSSLLSLGASSWLVSLIVNGILTGMCSVLSFLPQLLVIFLFINFLESTGYMSRVAFMFDRIFYKFGLSGKTLIPFIIGTGCSVPAISASRAIERSGEKEKTIILAPFVPCSAKLPIISLFVSYFFPKYSGLMTALVYFVAVVIILVSALILDKMFFKNKNNSFISELPEYKAPNIGLMMKDTMIKIKDFIVRAGSIIVICSIIVWFLSSFSFNLRFCESIEESVLAKLGHLFAWFFYPIVGEWNWAVGVSAIQGLIAKEQVVSSMSIISGLTGVSIGGNIFDSGIFSFFNKASALAFMTFNLFSAPCLASIGAMKNELKSTKKTIFAVLFQIMLAWIISSLIFQIGRLFL